MGKHKSELAKILEGNSDANIPFNDMRRVLINLGFKERIKGSHHIFSKSGIDEIINIQAKGKQGKPYQVKQLRNIIHKYNLEGQIDDQI